MRMMRGTREVERGEGGGTSRGGERATVVVARSNVYAYTVRQKTTRSSPHQQQEITNTQTLRHIRSIRFQNLSPAVRASSTVRHKPVHVVQSRPESARGRGRGRGARVCLGRECCSGVRNSPHGRCASSGVFFFLAPIGHRAIVFSEPSEPHGNRFFLRFW